MLLEDIGFYTLSNHRALNSSETSPLWRCELLITDKCNFKCPYCRGLKSKINDFSFETLFKTLQIWLDNGLKNVRFSGGEPLLCRELDYFVRVCNRARVDRIAISTNGSASFDSYLNLVQAGVNDFSISLDACCAQMGATMTGRNFIWDRVVSNIKELSKITYVSIGMVFTEQNVYKAMDTVLFADSLGVSDIRVIPSAQYNKALISLKDLPSEILEKYPILKYRINNITNGTHIRGIPSWRNNKCLLAIDDMAVLGNYHYPCIIYLREGGRPIGEVNENMRAERANWIASHDPASDPICKRNCLDVCVYYNAVAATR